MSEKKIRGYRRGQWKDFEGDRLPEGWSDKPPPGEHPNRPNEPKGSASEPAEAAPQVSASETYKREVEKVNRMPESEAAATPKTSEKPKK